MTNENDNGNVIGIGADQDIFLIKILENQRNKRKIFSKKRNSLLKYGKL